MNPANHLQALFDGLSAQGQRERASTQLTLGKLIEALSAMPPGSKVDGLHDAHSYRGYYDDLAFTPQDERITAENLLGQCRAAMGQVFCGYKGGDYVMGALTPLWVARYGDCGKKIMALHEDGTLELADDE